MKTFYRCIPRLRRAGCGAPQSRRMVRVSPSCASAQAMAAVMAATNAVLQQGRAAQQARKQPQGGFLRFMLRLAQSQPHDDSQSTAPPTGTLSIRSSCALPPHLCPQQFQRCDDMLACLGRVNHSIHQTGLGRGKSIGYPRSCSSLARSSSLSRSASRSAQPLEQSAERCTHPARQS